MRKFIKRIWKKIMFSLTKIYLFDKSIYLVNQIENLPKSEKTYSQFGQDSYVFNILFNT